MPENEELGEQPTLGEIQAIGNVILRHLIKKNSKKRYRMVEYLFQELASTSDKSVPLSAAALAKALGYKGEPHQVLNRVGSTKNRIQKALDAFFIRDGRTEKWRFDFARGDCRPHFKINVPPPLNVDYLRRFWQPHFDDKKPTYVLYPEPQFFMDEKGTYLRSREANNPDDRGRFAYLTDPGRLKSNYSYVPAGSVAALLRVLHYFHQSGRLIEAKPHAPHDPLPHGNLILLGTSTSLPAVATYERALPIRTAFDSINIDNEEQPLAGCGKTAFRRVFFSSEQLWRAI